MLDSNYWPEWQKNRVDFILSLFPNIFFKNKKILELGPFNGYIGARFQEIGANVYCLEGKEQNCLEINKNYPNLKVKCSNLDTTEWLWGKFDIIINFGLYYHLQYHHREHLLNCLNNCDLMFFETVILDDKNPKIFFRNESDNGPLPDQSMSNLGGTPSTNFVENIFKESGVEYQMLKDEKLNGNGHNYTWEDNSSNGFFYDNWRRFWIVNCKNKLDKWKN